MAKKKKTQQDVDAPTWAECEAWADREIAKLLFGDGDGARLEFDSPIRPMPAWSSEPEADETDDDLHEEFLMPWGKHRGSCVCTLPASYVSWLLAQRWLKRDIRAALIAEAQRRNAVVA
jgi:hypothetical protein